MGQAKRGPEYPWRASDRTQIGYRLVGQANKVLVFIGPTNAMKDKYFKAIPIILIICDRKKISNVLPTYLSVYTQYHITSDIVDYVEIEPALFPQSWLHKN